MKLLNTGIINNVIKYKHNLCYLTENALFIGENSFPIFDAPIVGFVIFNNRIYLNDWNGEYMIFSDLGKLVEKGSCKAFFESSDDYLGFQYYNGDLVREALLNVENSIINIDLLDKKNSINYSNRSIYCSLKDNLIFSYTLPEGQVLWQFNLADLGAYTPLHKKEQKTFEVVKFLGVWQNELLVSCKGGLLLAIDQQTGALIRKWQGMPKEADDYLKDVFKRQLPQHGYVFQLNQARTRIEGLFLYYYFYIDLESGTMHVVNCKDSLEKHHIQSFMYSSAYAEDSTHLFTKVHYDMESLGLDYIPTGLCAINKQSLEVDWHYRFDTHDDYLATENPQLSGNKLYQLSRGNVLYIFEKEEVA